MRFPYTQPLSKPEVSEIDKQIRNMTKINVASIHTNMVALKESSGIKVKWVISSG